MTGFTSKQKNYWTRENWLEFLEETTARHLGILKLLREKHGDFGILQIDAHCDLRNAYEGFNYSHASIMYNAIEANPAA